MKSSQCHYELDGVGIKIETIRWDRRCQSILVSLGVDRYHRHCTCVLSLRFLNGSSIECWTYSCNAHNTRSYQRSCHSNHWNSEERKNRIHLIQWTHNRIYEIFDKYCQIVNLQQLNTAHAQWCITLHTRNTTKFANLEVTIDAIGGLNSRWLSTKTTSTWYFFHSKFWVCIDIIDLTVTHQTNILTKSLPLRHRLLITDRIHFNVVIVVVVVSFLNRFWVSILEKHSDCFVYRAFMKKL